MHRILVRLLDAIEQHEELGPLRRQLGLNFTLDVVENNDPEMFVLPNGAIFVYTGYLNEIKNDDAFAAMLAHEISHALLQHRAEETSAREAIAALATASWAIGFAAISSIGKAGVLSVVTDKATQTLMSPAYRRDLEAEVSWQLSYA